MNGARSAMQERARGVPVPGDAEGCQRVCHESLAGQPPHATAPAVPAAEQWGGARPCVGGVPWPSTTYLVGVVAHELRAPLSAIKGFATLLLDYADRLAPAERRQMLLEIDAATDRMHELVDNLLDLTRLQAGMLAVRQEPVDLAAVLRQAVAEAAMRHPARSFRLELPSELPPIRGDARRIGQVVQNLLDNAVRYSPAESAVEVRAWRTSTGAAFAVIDHGIGIPAEQQERIFTPFYRVADGTADGAHGYGLGLAICRGLVEAHGGSITVDSQVGAGATFTVRLPGWRRPARV